MRAFPRVACVLVALGFASPAVAQDTLIPLFDGADGASCAYFNVGGRVRWKARLGDWKDAGGVSRGPRAYASATIDPTDQSRPISWDVTPLARAWLAGEHANSGVAIVTSSPRGSGIVAFLSRESADAGRHPRLVLERADGTRESLAPSADVHLDCSTVRPLGGEKQMKAGPDYTLLIRFDLPAGLDASALRRATLTLTTTTKQYGLATLGVYRLDPPVKVAPSVPHYGLAAGFPRDDGLDKHPDVLMSAGFDTLAWPLDWGFVRPDLGTRTVDDDAALGFVPLSGKALRVTIPRGGNLGLDLGYAFKSKHGDEPEEIYFRYYLRFAGDWVPTVDGGKLPGASGTYGRAGWGGRKWDGRAGWSLRGGFARAPSRDNPTARYVALSTYAYHGGAEDFWGDEWPWDVGLRGLVERNRWYSIEQYVRLNRVGAEDGEIMVWVDGEVAMHRTGIRLRDLPDIRIDKIWMNVYHGGTAPAAADMHLYIDGVVIARRYIGPMRRE